MRTHDPMVIHYVYDMDRAYAFYCETLGLSSDTRSDGWSTLRCGELLVALHIVEAGEEGPLPYAGLNLRVDDLDMAVKEVAQAGGSVLIVREAGGVRVRLAEVKDTEGNGFELRQFVGLV
jgi:predicted enzyme related to lactoylglutathione lyase